jgi:hypothetical protein
MNRTSLLRSSLLLAAASLLTLTTACSTDPAEGGDGADPEGSGGGGTGGGSGGDGTGGEPVTPSTHFSAEYSGYSLPQGGVAGRGFWHLAGGPEALGDDAWVLVDLDGDRLPDLVRTASLVSDQGNWVVRAFRGARWSLPAGGVAGAGYPSIGGGPSDVGDDAWTLADLDGDGRPDLVRTGSLVSEQGNWSTKAFSDANGSFWAVHANTGSGFAAEGARWALPAGGLAGQSYPSVGGSPNELGDDAWSLVDLDGDRLPDLVRTASLVAEQGDWSLNAFSDGAGYFWAVHANTGSGFAADGSRWALPAGGLAGHGYPTMGGSPNELGDDAWSLVDLDGDRLPDLVRTASLVADQGNWSSKAYSDGNGSFWAVHFNDGDGFATDGARWALPAGGVAGRSYYTVGGTPEDLGDDVWTLVDLEGDGLPDLVRTASLVADQGDWESRAFTDDAGTFWAIHKNDGAGFAADGVRWGLPQGGVAGRGFWSLGGAPEQLGDDHWAVTELNGDGRPDLVVTSHLVAQGDQWIPQTEGYPGASTWRVALGMP